jgi:hypothetical protein
MSTARDQQTEIAIIADIIANLEDWTALDPSEEASKLILKNCPQLSPDIGPKIMKAYFSIPIQVRASTTFDHLQFVSSQLSEVL